MASPLPNGMDVDKDNHNMQKLIIRWNMVGKDWPAKKMNRFTTKFTWLVKEEHNNYVSYKGFKIGRLFFLWK